MYRCDRYIERCHRYIKINEVRGGFWAGWRSSLLKHIIKLGGEGAVDKVAVSFCPRNCCIYIAIFSAEWAVAWYQRFRHFETDIRSSRIMRVTGGQAEKWPSVAWDRYQLMPRCRIPRRFPNRRQAEDSSGVWSDQVGVKLWWTSDYRDLGSRIK